MTVRPRTPVLMYHSVGRPPADWLWKNLTVKVELFERQLEVLRRHGFGVVTLDELRARQEAGRDGRDRDVVLTFDDGYLDNWVYAYPLLKRAGWRGTIYVNPDFLDPGEEPRPTLEDHWEGRCTLDELPGMGFLNRAELRALHASGVMTIASHSMTHTWYPTGPRVVDRHRPDRRTPWLAWNARPERKHAYLTEDQSGFVPFGTPILEHGRSLGVRRWFPDEERHETDAEMLARFRHEIVGAKELLEDVIGAEVAHFAWPGGAYCDASWEIAERAGFRTIVVNGADRARWDSDDPRLVRRIGCGKLVASVGGRYETDDPVFVLRACQIALGETWRAWDVRLRKFLVAARAGFRADATVRP